MKRIYDLFLLAAIALLVEGCCFGMKKCGVCEDYPYIHAEFALDPAYGASYIGPDDDVWVYRYKDNDFTDLYDSHSLYREVEAGTTSDFKLMDIMDPEKHKDIKSIRIKSDKIALDYKINSFIYEVYDKEYMECNECFLKKPPMHEKVCTRLISYQVNGVSYYNGEKIQLKK